MTRSSLVRGLLGVGMILWVGYLVTALLGGCAAAAVTACDRATVDVASAPGPLGALRDRDAEIGAAVAISVTCGTHEWTGSGALVSPTQVLTARHVGYCSESPSVVTVRRVTGTADAFPAHLVWDSEEWDLARLELAGDARLQAVAVPEVAPPPGPAGALCFVSGSPLAEVECGAETSLDPAGGVGDLRHTATTVPGNSGSGVYDARGRLVAVVTQFVDCTPTATVRTYCAGAASSVWGRKGVLP